MAATGAPGTILVTGGSSGLGEATARELAGAGYNVVVRTALPSDARCGSQASEHTPTDDCATVLQIADLNDEAATPKPKLTDVFGRLFVRPLIDPVGALISPAAQELVKPRRFLGFQFGPAPPQPPPQRTGLQRERWPPAFRPEDKNRDFEI